MRLSIPLFSVRVSCTTKPSGFSTAVTFLNTIRSANNSHSVYRLLGKYYEFIGASGPPPDLCIGLARHGFGSQFQR
ncbi:protein of unknown function [Alcaligenes faecalis subsp. faecalis]|nr:protein of unknown function [Alcaligenes faecalis subsp. faecalis]